MFGLSFLYPLFLVAAAAAAIPIVLHLFRRKTEMVVDFPAVRLLERAPVEQQRRRRLREVILLALRVLALVLLAAAFARPYLDRSGVAFPATTRVVALDTSLSLSAPGQFDAARRAARQAIEAAPATERLALVTFGDAATLLVPATTERGTLLAAIDRTVPTAGGTRYRTALARAAEAIGSSGGRIVVVTDLQQVGWEAGDEGAVPDGIDVEVLEVPPPRGNVAVTAARRAGPAIVAAVHNFGESPVRLPVRLRVEGREVMSQPIDIAAQAAAEVRLVAALPPQGGAEILIDDADGYQGDNARYLVLDPPGAVPVVVITAEPPGSSNAGLYIERALAVADEGRAFAVRVVDGRTFSALSPAAFGQPGALIVLGTSTLDRAGREAVAGFLQRGGRVLVALGPDVDLATLSDTVGAPMSIEPVVADARARAVALVAVDGRHPIFRPFLSPTGALGDVYIEEYRRLNDQEGRTVLARFTNAGNAMTEQMVGTGRLLLFASDLDTRWNRFPLNPAFVPWAIETARYLTQGREQPMGYTLPDVPSDVPAVPGVHQSGAVGASAADIASAAGGSGSTSGAASRKTDSDATAKVRRVAVNPDIRESNPARTSAEEFTGAISRLTQVAATRAQAQARDQEERQRLWQIGLLVMLVALAAEGFIGRRAT